jgi:hypothetical protein
MVVELYDFIAQVRLEYQASGEVIPLPNRGPHVSRADFVRLSSLKMCRRAHTFSKARTTPSNPAVLGENDPDKAWLMDHGNYVAPMIQAPLYWKSARTLDMSFKPEEDVIDYELMAAGRMDGLLIWKPDGKHYEERVLEIKDTEGLAKRSVGEPKLSYAYQGLAACMIEEISHLSIITCSHWNYHVWNVVALGGRPENGFQVQDRWGTPYVPLIKREPNWNVPEMLNFDAVREEIRLLREDMEQFKRIGSDPTKMVTPPIADPLNDPGCWQCVWKADKGTKKRAGMAEVNCEFAGYCHGLTNTTYPIEKVEDGGYQFINDF